MLSWMSGNLGGVTASPMWLKCVSSVVTCYSDSVVNGAENLNYYVKPLNELWYMGWQRFIFVARVKSIFWQCFCCTIPLSLSYNWYPVRIGDAWIYKDQDVSWISNYRQRLIENTISTTITRRSEQTKIIKILCLYLISRGINNLSEVDCKLLGDNYQL